MGVLQPRRVVDDGDAGRRREQLAGLRSGQLGPCLHVDGFAVRAEHRHAHAGGRHLEVRVGEDLDRLVDHLLLFFGRSGGQEAVDVRQKVEGDLVRIELLFDRLAGGPLVRLRSRAAMPPVRCRRRPGRC